jgi:hypothetical protein
MTPPCGGWSTRALKLTVSLWATTQLHSRKWCVDQIAPLSPQLHKATPSSDYTRTLPHVSSTPSLSSIPTILTHSPTQPTTPMKLSALTVASAAFCFTHSVAAGPIGYGICQAGCAAVVMACYSAAGATWGATLGATAPASVLACNTAFGTCQAACAAVLLSPTP